jgi:hypothetical protein
MKRSRILNRIALASVTLVALAALSAGAAEPLCLSHSRGRVAISLPLYGGLGLCSHPEEDRGIRWPGIEGIEFLGKGGLYIRLRAPGESEQRVIAPDQLDPVFVAGDGLNEGCAGGKRYPHPDRDDDGDGRTDEDPVDGIDNDGDGSIDEDFAALGSEMKVVRALDGETGLAIQQSSYTWTFGHVRDIVGFTTTIRCDRRDGRSLEELEAVLYAEFRVGKADDPYRGRDDRSFFLEVPTAKGRIRAAVTAGAQYHIALVPLDVVGPYGFRRGIDAELLGLGDSLWIDQEHRGRDETDPIVEMIPEDNEPETAVQVRFIPSLEGDYMVTGETKGETAIACAIDPFRSLEVGEEIRIEWALVLGKSLPALVRNLHRAVETYTGIVDKEGRRHSWVVPARRAVRIELEASPALAWSRGQRQTAAAIMLPPELEDEEVEWLRATNGEFVDYQQVGGKLIVMVDGLLAEGERVEIEGQLTDGTVLATVLDEAALRSDIDDEASSESLPDESIQLYPNPFLSSLNISLRIYDPSLLAGEEGGESSVRIYDVRGRLVRTVLEQGLLHPGEYVRAWDGYDEHGKEAAPGVYYVKLQIGDRSVTKRVILLR